MIALKCEKATKFFYRKSENRNGRGVLAFIRKPRELVKAVDNISFEVRTAEIFGIVGPNGSGKSTLIRMLSTLLLPDEGQISIFGKDVVRHPLEVRRQINRVSVDAAFFKKLSAWENLSYAARLYGLSMSEAKRRAFEILSEMGFERGNINEPVEELSRGMQQKVAIARALFTSPVMLLLDEPTTGLDPVSKRQVQNYILYVRKIHNTTVLLTSHDMAECERICDRVAIIDRGRFIAMDKVAGLKRLVTEDIDSISLEDVFFKITGKKMD